MKIEENLEKSDFNIKSLTSIPFGGPICIRLPGPGTGYTYHGRCPACLRGRRYGGRLRARPHATRAGSEWADRSFGIFHRFSLIFIDFHRFSFKIIEK